MTQILKVLVGSRAHGLHRPDSDFDYRGVFITPTPELLSLKAIEKKPKGTHWVEGEDEDNTSYELAHFLHLATKSNPSILEVFKAPVVESTPLGEALLELFPYVWSSRRVVEAFTGYAHNQQKKMLGDKYSDRPRKWKYAVAYLRTLVQARELLSTGDFSLKVPYTLVQDFIDVRNGERSIGWIMDVAEGLKTAVYNTYERCQEDGSENFTAQNRLDDFLLKVRKDNWYAQ